MMFSATFFLCLASYTVLAVSENLNGCEENFVKVGCYKDKTRPLPKLLLDKRKQLKDGWENWENFLKSLACSCAKITRSEGFTYFGLQFFAECWSGVQPNVTYAHDGISRGCVGQILPKPCEQAHPVCVGRAKKNYVYKLVTPSSAPDCKDSNDKLCPEYADKGYCEVYPNVKSQCPYSCDTCQ